MNGMFNNATSFNNGGSPSINLWNVSGVTNMSFTFYTATNFNQPIGGWDVSNVTNMENMLSLATIFDQPIGGWDVSSVTNMSFMLNGTSLSTPNYDLLLNGWASLGGSLQPSVNFNAGTSVYTIATAGVSRNYLTGTKLWNITDGGGI
jgi:surface protein